jgi:hypothetical protein
VHVATERFGRFHGLDPYPERSGSREERVAFGEKALQRNDDRSARRHRLLVVDDDVGIFGDAPVFNEHRGAP